MTTYSDYLPATKTAAERTVFFTPSEVADRSGLISILNGREWCQYFVIEFDADEGRGFRLMKTEDAPGTDRDTAAYAVFCSPAGPEHDSCDCRGFQRHGHCKHSAAVRGAVDNRWL
jgi:hypothetical protein